MSVSEISHPSALKYISLCLLTLQNSIAILSVRYSRARSGEIAIASTVVLLTEVYKLACSLFLACIMDKDQKSFLKSLKMQVFGSPIDALQVLLPALIYLLQNNLIFLGAKHLDAPTHQVVYQLKILTTAILSVIILKRNLKIMQWISLTLLVVGIIIVQLSGTEEYSKNSVQKGLEVRWIGLVAVIMAAICSGLGSVLFEKVLKRVSITIWVRNVQLALSSVVISLVSFYFGVDSDEIQTKGFFHGYDYYVLYLIVLQGSGGLMVAMVSKYADSILKGFAFCMSIILCCIISMIFFQLQLTFGFVLGAMLVFFSTFLYSIV